MKIIVFPSDPDKITSKNAGTKQWYWHQQNKGRITSDGEGHNDRAKAIRAAKGVVLATLKKVGVVKSDLTWTTSPRDDLGEGAVELDFEWSTT
jgi:hypothetical protein